MTTIVWDGKTLAVDRQASTEYGYKFEMRKLHDVSFGYARRFFASCGDLGLNLEFADWFRSGSQKDKIPVVDEKLSFGGTLLEIPDDGAPRIFGVNRRGVLLPQTEYFYTDGSGRDFALMAMHLGKGAVDALLLTMEFDAHTGLGIDWVDVRGKMGMMRLERRPLLRSSSEAARS